jgi:hypothetical protein
MNNKTNGLERRFTSTEASSMAFLDPTGKRREE